MQIAIKIRVSYPIITTGLERTHTQCALTHTHTHTCNSTSARMRSNNSYKIGLATFYTLGSYFFFYQFYFDRHHLFCVFFVLLYVLVCSFFFACFAFLFCLNCVLCTRIAQHHHVFSISVCAERCVCELLLLLFLSSFLCFVPHSLLRLKPFVNRIGSRRVSMAIQIYFLISKEKFNQIMDINASNKNQSAFFVFQFVQDCNAMLLSLSRSLSPSCSVFLFWSVV